MRTSSTNRNRLAFSTTELLVIVAVIAIISGIVLRKTANDRDRARRIACVGSLKSFSMGLRLFANDAGDYPFKLLSNATNVPPALAPFSTNNATDLWKLFEVAANDLSSPHILICPSDFSRRMAGSFGTNGVPDEFSHTNNRLNALSYFLSLDADEAQPGNILTGDRHLTTDPETSRERNTKFLFGQQDVGSDSPTAKSVRWISTIHNGGGNAAFMDGSARRLGTEELRQMLKQQPAAANRIWLPNSDATGRGNP